MKRTFLALLTAAALLPLATAQAGPAASKVPNRERAALASDAAPAIELAGVSTPKRLARAASGNLRTVRFTAPEDAAMERAEFARLETVADASETRTYRRASGKVPNRFRHFD